MPTVLAHCAKHLHGHRVAYDRVLSLWILSFKSKGKE